MQVVELMQTIYNLENKDRKRMKWLFSIFPCIGLLNVAVSSLSFSYTPHHLKLFFLLHFSGFTCFKVVEELICFRLI